MSLVEIETLLQQLQSEVKANTAAITTLTNTISNYATTDDLTAISKQINTLQNNNILLQNTVATLSVEVDKVDHLVKLSDIRIENLTTNDVLQYGDDGLWHNVSPTTLGITSDGGSSSGGASKLADLSDVYISGISNGQALVYSAINNKWINATINNSGNTGGGSTGDLSKYLLASDAEKLYLLKAGGTITGNLNVNGLTTLGNNLLVKGGVTMYNE